MDPLTCQIDDFGPLTVRQPESVTELGDAVRSAAAGRQAVYPLGGRTMLGIGLPPSRPGVGLDLRALNRVIDYPARDMTITVQAGLTLAKLQDLLRGENQRLPIDVPHADRATLGGALATNTSGPRRYGFGTLRDYVIGISVVNDEGQETKAGGRVVKNVAGYDLCKLHVGALGTLGVISQVTLKLRPLPEAQASVVCGAESGQIEALLARVHESRTRPVCVDLLNRAAARWIQQHAGVSLPETAWVLVVGYEDNAGAVDWQVQQLSQEVSTTAVLRGPAADPLWRALVELADGPEAALTFKANLLPSATAAFCRRAEELAGDVLLQAHAGNGIVLGHLPGDSGRERAEQVLKVLRQAAVAAQGNLTLPRCPVAWKRTLPVWGEPSGDRWLMQAVREKFDPRGVFNPGRFL